MILVAVIKGKNSSGYFVKLMKYTITGNSFLAQFYFVNKPSINIVNSGIPVGVQIIGSPCYGSCEDAVAEIQCQSGIAGTPTTMSGIVSINGNEYTFDYGSGSKEIWSRAADGKFTLISANYSINTPYGWGFESEISGPLNFSGTFYGELQRYNGWNNTEEPVRCDILRLYEFAGTTSGAMRRVQWDPGARCWVHSYFARIGLLAIFQTSHDFDSGGRIDGEKGHTYFGYPIIQNGQHRGFVFADASEAPPEGTFSAIYYWG